MSKKVVFPVFTAATIGFALAAYGCKGEMHIGDEAKAPVPSTTAPPVVSSTPAPVDTPPAPPPPAPAPKQISLKGATTIGQTAQIQMPGDIEFQSGSHQIVMNDKSKLVLNTILKLMQDNPNVTTLRIEGHTDNEGKDDYNKNLSNQRAGEVAAWLKKQGIDPARLHSIGLGPKCPLVANDTKEHKATNRRTEFHLEQMDNKKVDGDTQDANGCSAAAAGGGASAGAAPAASAAPSAAPAGSAKK
jgi:outer membrane protein OmpA-like peptidoglycan-associated protein